MAGSPTEGIKTVLHPVSDLAAAKPVYAALVGVPPQAGRLLAGAGHRGEAGRADCAGATVKEPARDVGGGRLVATVTDPDGNVLGLLQDR